MTADGQFVSCDWGTSRLRLHLVGAEANAPLASATSEDGVARVHQAWSEQRGQPGGREVFYLRRVATLAAQLREQSGQPIEHVPVVISGMASANIGLRELPYREMPFALDGSDLRCERLATDMEEFDSSLLISGARTSDDLMRGEETQIVGAVALGADPRSLFILPGTHSKHVRTDGHRATGIATYMTGEFFELLARRSLLANSVEATDGHAGDSPSAAFDEGVTVGARENLLHAAFGVRVAHVSGTRPRAEGADYLSGVLVGAELQELSKSPVASAVVVSNATLARRYERGLRILRGATSVTSIDAERAVIAGQRAIARLVGLL